MFDDNESLEAARRRNVHDALYEDIGVCDWTAQLVPADHRIRATVTVREDAVLCGSDWFVDCFRTLDPHADLHWSRQEGEDLHPGEVVCEIESSARAALSAERPALNFLQLLSAVATETRRYVRAIEGLSPNPRGCVVLDTRKTLPGLRRAQKYAVRMGGGTNHRMALWDGILIKENHIAAAGGIAAALDSARDLNAGVDIQIEVENLEELEAALVAGAEYVLLDNFTLEDMRSACDLNRGRAMLEVSGGVDLDSVRAIAATGVDRVSSGKLTKDIRAIDFSLRVVPG